MEGAAIFPWPGVEPQSRQQGIIAKHFIKPITTSATEKLRILCILMVSLRKPSNIIIILKAAEV